MSSTCARVGGPGCQHTRYLINPSGPFVTGGPDGDAGLTGRKIIVDTYGGASVTVAGPSAGRTPPRLTAQRRMRCAGLLRMLSLRAGRQSGDSGLLRDWNRPPREHFRGDLRYREGTGGPSKTPSTVFLTSALRRSSSNSSFSTPFLPTAAYGHFGRTDHDFPWERLNRVEELRQASGL
jgi:S-adenosylmethionine synthetase